MTGGSSSDADSRRLERIAYVTNTWWPKIDGAAIAISDHVKHFVAAGHPVLVVRPSYPANSPLSCRTHLSGDRSDPMPPTKRLTYVTFRMSGARGGGYEPEMESTDFARVERALAAWAPDILLVADPDMFMMDTNRLPGFNALVRGRWRPTTIASLTTFMVEVALKMPEFWWMHALRLKPLLEAGLSTAYGAFDYVFVHGQHTLDYLGHLTVPLHGGGTRPLSGRTQVWRPQPAAPPAPPAPATAPLRNSPPPALPPAPAPEPAAGGGVARRLALVLHGAC